MTPQKGTNSQTHESMEDVSHLNNSTLSQALRWTIIEEDIWYQPLANDTHGHIHRYTCMHTHYLAKKKAGIPSMLLNSFVLIIDHDNVLCHFFFLQKLKERSFCPEEMMAGWRNDC